MIRVPGPIVDAIGSAKKIGLMTHLNGDGDAFGSLLGLQRILNQLGKEVIVFSNEPLPPYFDYLKSQTEYNPTDVYQKVDLLIGLDLISVERFTIPEIFRKAKNDNAKIAIIDHHTLGEIHGMADYLWREENASSTAELIYWLCSEMKIDLDSATAQLILTGLEHDTYFLTNKNVFGSTKEAQKALWSFGGDTEKIKKSVEDASPTKNEILMKRATENLKIEKGIIFTYLSMENKNEAGLPSENISSVISSYFDTKEKPRVSICAEDRVGGMVKVSMRSNNSEVDVAEICRNFGGGGHVHAAGFELTGSLDDYLKNDFFDNLISEIS